MPGFTFNRTPVLKSRHQKRRARGREEVRIDLDRCRLGIERSASKALQEVIDRSERQRCIECFETARQILEALGLPTFMPAHRNAAAPLPFRDMLSLLVRNLDSSAVDYLDLRYLLNDGKICRDAAAHCEVRPWRRLKPKICADRLWKIASRLVALYERLQTAKPTNELRPMADRFYEAAALMQISAELNAALAKKA